MHYGHVSSPQKCNNLIHISLQMVVCLLWRYAWYPPPLGVVKFNVDGASRGKPGPAGIGGVLRYCKGEVLMMFSKYVSVGDSNEADVLAILEGLRLRLLWKVIPLMRSYGCLSGKLILRSFIST